jgi:hypothetical protein
MSIKLLPLGEMHLSGTKNCCDEKVLNTKTNYQIQARFNI